MIYTRNGDGQPGYHANQFNQLNSALFVQALLSIIVTLIVTTVAQIDDLYDILRINPEVRTTLARMVHLGAICLCDLCLLWTVGARASGGAAADPLFGPRLLMEWLVEAVGGGEGAGSGYMSYFNTVRAEYSFWVGPRGWVECITLF